MSAEIATLCETRPYLSMTPPVTRGVAHLEMSTVDSSYYDQHSYDLKNNYRPLFVFIEDNEKF